MNLKLDENLDARLTSVLRRAGHEVSTVREQGLAGVDDQALYVHSLRVDTPRLAASGRCAKLRG